MDYKFNHVVIGGTFDHFHIGHKALLDKAFNIGKKVSIGIALPDLYAKKILSQYIEKYKTRESYVKEYLTQKNFLSRSSIVPIKDFYGNTLIDKTLDAIIVTESTLKNAKIINEKRKEKSLFPLEIITIPLLKADDSTEISSENIRLGRLTKDGHSYLKAFQQKKKFILPENLRPTLRIPTGSVFKNINDLKKVLKDKSIIIAVGDIVAMSLIDAGFNPAISIIDYKSRRRKLIKNKIGKYFPHTSPMLKNPAGAINSGFTILYKKAIDDYLATGKKQTIAIEGEEDLLALPAILLAPLDSRVLYGQFDLGVVIVKVTKKVKSYYESLLKKFE